MFGIYRLRVAALGPNIQSVGAPGFQVFLMKLATSDEKVFGHLFSVCLTVCGKYHKSSGIPPPSVIVVFSFFYLFRLGLDLQSVIGRYVYTNIPSPVNLERYKEHTPTSTTAQDYR